MFIKNYAHCVLRSSALIQSCLIFVSVFFCAGGALAQTISLSDQTIAIDRPQVSVTAQNNGAIATQPFRIKLWVSIDDQFTESDLPVISGDFTLAGCTSTPCPRTDSFERPFKFPLPGVDTPPDERLVGDTRTPLEWMGEVIFIQACLSLNGGPFTTGCVNVERRVVPYRSFFVRGGPNNFDNIELSWAEPPLYNGVPLIEQFQINYSRLDSTGGGNTIFLNYEDVQIIDVNGVRRQRVELTDIEPGVAYSIFGRTCTELGGSAVCNNGASGASGYLRLANFDASVETSNDSITVSWQEYATFAKNYRITRCRVDEPENCVEFIRPSKPTSFEDTTVTQRVEYVYSIEACTDRSGDPDVCENYRFTGVTNAGITGLSDQFEDDDNAAQAKTIEGSVSQTRSFDTPEDEDWVRLVVTAPQSLTIRTSGETSEDTAITLYNEALEQIDFSGNTVGVVTSYATLVTEELEPGIYFAKINQETIPGLPALRVFNYTLDVEFNASDSSKAYLPSIIDLLLSD